MQNFGMWNIRIKTLHTGSDKNFSVVFSFLLKYSWTIHSLKKYGRSGIRCEKAATSQKEASCVKLHTESHRHSSNSGFQNKTSCTDNFVLLNHLWRAMMYERVHSVFLTWAMEQKQSLRRRWFLYRTVTSMYCYTPKLYSMIWQKIRF